METLRDRYFTNILGILILAMAVSLGMVVKDHFDKVAALKLHKAKQSTIIDTLMLEKAVLISKLDFINNLEQPQPIKVEKVTRGMRNKNPFNVVAMSEKRPWLGQVGKDEQNHAIFESYEHGIRAGYLVLRKYYEERKINTLIGITSRFCEGDALRYARFISKETGLPHDKPIDVIGHMVPIMKAMITFENGYNPFDDSFFVAYNGR